MILDEATSSLDYETENEIVNSILNIKGKQTIIIVAHRLSTVQICNPGGEIIGNMMDVQVLFVS